MSRPWTCAERRRLAEGRQAGENYKTLARELGRTPCAVVQFAHREGLRGQLPAHRRHWTTLDERALLDAYRAGIPVGVLAERFGRSPNAVHARIRTLRERGESVVWRRPRWSAREKAQLHQLRAAGLSWVQIGLRLQRSPGACSKQYHDG